MKPRRILLAVALIVSALLHLQSPLRVDDPFAESLVFLPLVIVAFIEMERWARRQGQRGKRRSGQAMASALAAGILTLATIGRSALGLGSVDNALAAAWVLLLAWQVLRLLPAMRRSLGTALPDRPPWIFFLLPLTVYVAILPWSAAHHPPDGDEPHYLLLTHSLAYDLDSDLANNYAARDSVALTGRILEPQPGDPVGDDGELYSRHNLLLPLVLAPAYRIAGVPGALLVMTLLAALLVWMTLRLARHYVPDHPGETMLAWAILAFTPPLLFYAYQVWVEVPAALLAVLALDAIHRLKAGASERHPFDARVWVELCAAVVLLPLLKIRFLLISAPLLLLALRRGGARVRRGLVLLAVGLLLLTVGILIFNQALFDNPLKYHDVDGLATYSNPPIKYLEGLLGLLYDCAFGLFAYAPIWLLLLPATLLSLKLRDRLPRDFAIAFTPYLLLLSPRGEWFGAWSPPFRYGMVMLPLVALVLVPLLARRRRAGARAMLACLVAVSLALTVLWVVQPGWTYNLAHGRTHLLDQLGTSIGGDAARFFPSSIRPRAATWIWPVASLLLVPLAWWLPRRRWRRSATVWGTALALLAPALVVGGTMSVPTREIELEDPWVTKTGGQLYPDLWVVYRPRFDGGWALPAKSGLSAPVVAGGDRVSISLRLRNPTERARPTTLVMRAGNRVLTSWAMPRDGEWTIYESGEFQWRSGDELRLDVESPVERPRRTHVILHRARLNWR